MKKSTRDPLVEDDIRSTISEIQDSYITLNKDLNSLKHISSSSDNELSYNRNEYHSLKTQISNNLNTIKQLLNKLTSIDIPTNKLQKEVSSLFDTIDQKKLANKENEYEMIIKSIDERFMNYAPLIGNDSLYQSSIQEDPLSGNLIQFKDCENELMQRRTEQMEQVKRITTEVASLSNDIKLETFAQGEKVNKIEGNLETMKANVKQAEKEAQETEILTRKNKKGLLFLCFILLFLIFIIVYLISKMIK